MHSAGKRQVSTASMGLPVDGCLKKDGSARLASWVEAPISTWWCLLGWCVATGIFVAAVARFGGPSWNDANLSTLTTMAIAHGQLRCAFPASPAPIAPLYPLFSGLIAAVIGTGHSVAFPQASALGAHCATSYDAINNWATRTGAIAPTLRIAFSSWLVLLVGVTSFLRAVGIGGRRLEPITVVAIACLPMTWMCVASFFHPEDLTAMGLCLTAIACAIRGRWVGAGLLIAAGVLTQQFSLLVAVPLLVLAPAEKRGCYAKSAVLTWAVVAAALLLITSGTVAHALIFGSGSYGTTSGGTLLWEMHLSGTSGTPVLFLLSSRLPPLLIAAALARWLVNQIGSRLWAPEGLVAVIALMMVSLAARLLFEQGLHGYFFMATAVMLLLLDVTKGHLRSSTVAWLVTVTLVYCSGIVPVSVYPHPWSGAPLDLLEWAVVIISISGLTFAIMQGRRLVGGVWLVPIAVAIITFEGPVEVSHHVPLWIWQIVLVSWALTLGGSVMLREVRSIRSSTQAKDLETSPDVDAQVESAASQAHSPSGLEML